MKYSAGKTGRFFVIRLEDGDILHESVEAVARQEKIRSAVLVAVGGADRGSVLIVGPEQARSETIVPMEHVLDDVYEVTGTGTLFPNARDEPVLHMHLSCGRKDRTVTGCVRRGVKVWQVMEVVLQEITESNAKRLLDPGTGFELLQP